MDVVALASRPAVSGASRPRLFTGEDGFTADHAERKSRRAIRTSALFKLQITNHQLQILVLRDGCCSAGLQAGCIGGVPPAALHRRGWLYGGSCRTKKQTRYPHVRSFQITNYKSPITNSSTSRWML